MRPAQIAAQTQRNYPAPIAILDCLFEGTMLPFDKALELESKYFAKLLCDPVSRNIIRTHLRQQGRGRQAARAAPQVPKSKVTKLGVLGAGMMGCRHRLRGRRRRHRGDAARSPRLELADQGQGSIR